MLTSRMFAPPRTCSSATSTASWNSPALDQAPEARRPGDVRPLSDHDEVRLGEDAERLEAAEPVRPLAFRDTSRGLTPGRGRDRLDVFGRGAAAAADDVHQPVLGEPAQRLARVLRAARRACPSRSGGPHSGGTPPTCRRDAREVLDEWTHLRRAERAVDADDERPGVLDREPERVDGLAGEVAAAAVDGRERDPERQVRRDVERGGDGGLGVQRVEDRLDQQEVDAAFGQAANLIRVGRRTPGRTCACGTPGRRPAATARASR